MRRDGSKAAAAALLLCAAVPASAQAQAWRRSSSAGDATGFIDTASIRRDGDRVFFQREVRYAQPKAFSTGEKFDRILVHYEGDCKAMTLRAHLVRVRLGDKLVLEFSDKDRTDSAGPGSNAEKDLQAACFGKWQDAG